MAEVVVGVDGSKGSLDALHVAVDEARLRGATLRVVMAWMLDPASAAGIGGFSCGVDPVVMEQSARAELDHTLAAVAGQASGVHIESVLSMGPPARVLIAEAEDAGLLVVGSRGHGGFAGLLLGSVSHQCALHATCPVLIVHGPR